MSNKLPPAVIGAGISGLTAAYKLVRAGLTPVIYEPGSLGGVIKTTHLQGFTLEHGPNVVLGKDALNSLVKDLGLESEVVLPVTSKYKQFVWHNGKAEIVPKGPLRLLKTPLIPLGAKLRLPFNLAKRNLIPSTVEDLSVFQLFSKIIGEEGVARLLDPALRGIVGGELKGLSARSMFEPLWNHLAAGGSILSFMKSRKGSPKKRVFVFKKGMQSLSTALAEVLHPSSRIEPTRIKKLKRVGAKFDLTTEDGRTVSHSHVFVATAGADSANFLTELVPSSVSMLQALQFASIVVVHAAVKKPGKIPQDSFGVLFPSTAPTQLMGVMYNSVLFPHLSPADRDLLTICLGGANRSQILNLSDSEIEQITKSDVKQLLGIEISELLKIHRWQSVIPQYTLGHWKLVKELLNCETRHPGLYFCGADIGGVGVPDRVEAASQALLRAGIQ